MPDRLFATQAARKSELNAKLGQLRALRVLISATVTSPSPMNAPRDLIFFFSSRRRHTRLQGDWSSDVCSSDLHDPQTAHPTIESTGRMSNPILLIQIHARHDTQGPITMATEAQANANRKNSKKSTGPRTPEGKTISSRNSLVHGMTSGKFLPPDGDPDEFFQLLDQFRDRFQPFDQAEDALVERLVAAEFKMRSVRYLDAGLFHYQAESSPMPEQFNKEGSTNPMAWAFNYDAAQHNSFSKLI